MMRCLRYLRGTAAGLVCLTWFLPIQTLSAATPATQPPRVIRDVALSPDGRLAGKLVDASGVAVRGQPVIVEGDKQAPQRSLTDAGGRFAVANLRGGVHRVSAGNAVGVFRCWTADAAPPAASQEVLLVEEGEVERGQMPFGEFLFSNPVILAVVIAAAIAIPIAIHNSQDRS